MDTGRNWAAVYPPPPLWGELGPPLTQCRLGEAYLRTKWHLDVSRRLATTDMGRKLVMRPFLFLRGGSLVPI